MSTPDEIRERIRTIESEPDSRINRLRLNSLRVLLASRERAAHDEGEQ